MNQHLKTIKRYETRDGAVHDEHELAIRHEYYHAIPHQLAKLVGEKTVHELREHDLRAVVDVLLGTAQNVIDILSDYLENAEVVNEFDRDRQRSETAQRILREKGVNPLKDAMHEARDA
jgi:phosphomannomutase